MPAIRWTTEAELKALTSCLASYNEAKTAKSQAVWDQHWRKVDAEFFAVSPLVVEGTFDNEKSLQDARAAAMKAKVKQIKTWFQNNAVGSTTRLKADPEFHSDPQGPKRAKKDTEVFSNKNYETKVKPLVSKILEGHAEAGDILTAGDRLRIVNQQTRIVLDLEDEAVKTDMKSLATASKPKVPDVIAERTPESMARAIKKAPAAIEAGLQAWADKAGWFFSVVGGGPDPNNNGKIKTISLNVGVNDAGLVFSEAYPLYKKEVLCPYTMFLDSSFSPELRALRTIILKEEEKSKQDMDTAEDKDGEKQTESEPEQRAETGSTNIIQTVAVESAGLPMGPPNNDNSMTANKSTAPITVDNLHSLNDTQSIPDAGIAPTSSISIANHETSPPAQNIDLSRSPLKHSALPLSQNSGSAGVPSSFVNVFLDTNLDDVLGLGDDDHELELDDGAKENRIPKLPVSHFPTSTKPKLLKAKDLDAQNRNSAELTTKPKPEAKANPSAKRKREPDPSPASGVDGDDQRPKRSRRASDKVVENKKFAEEKRLEAQEKKKKREAFGGQSGRKRGAKKK
ncbi:hypothetical protein C8J56DRAFT_1166580 [Mycena floridula]|nr:hypothetical protein C8J56DRAFT_1166580 [Mycena floridula]